VEFTLLSLGRELGTARLEGDRVWQDVRFALPRDFPRGPAHLGLVVREGWRPANTGDGPDARRPLP
jgi:hypothetical protein